MRLSILFLLALTACVLAEYRTKNGRITRNGVPLSLKGVNWHGFNSPRGVPSLLSKYSLEEIFKMIKLWGINALRIPFCGHIRSNPIPKEGDINYDLNRDFKIGTRPLGVYEILDKIMSMAHTQEVYVILAFERYHCNQINDPKGLWYTHEYSEKEWTEILCDIVGRYISVDYFLGIDIKEEPHGITTWGNGNIETDFNSAAERAIDAIDDINVNVLIMIQGIANSNASSEAKCNGDNNHIPGSNLEGVRCNKIVPNEIGKNHYAWSPPMFGPDRWPHVEAFKAPNFPQNMPDIWDKHFGYLMYGDTPIVVAHFGGDFHRGSRARAYEEAVLKWLTSKNLCDTFYYSLSDGSHIPGGLFKADLAGADEDRLAHLQKFWKECTPQPINVTRPRPADDNTPVTDNNITGKTDTTTPPLSQTDTGVTKDDGTFERPKKSKNRTITNDSTVSGEDGSFTRPPRKRKNDTNATNTTTNTSTTVNTTNTTQTPNVTNTTNNTNITNNTNTATTTNVTNTTNNTNVTNNTNTATTTNVTNTTNNTNITNNTNTATTTNVTNTTNNTNVTNNTNTTTANVKNTTNNTNVTNNTNTATTANTNTNGGATANEDGTFSRPSKKPRNETNTTTSSNSGATANEDGTFSRPPKKQREDTKVNEDGSFTRPSKTRTDGESSGEREAPNVVDTDNSVIQDKSSSGLSTLN
eukprot:TRINITY_DN452_c0_g1_i4.p1 TRINITY_DN452_c0_g1~~TRINITY_DN452_c0_g1_i4.p1  ORF type:complete len:696 (-),score=177.50 TRINITY_DN452_c0_g1_i4:388-2475(-)